MLDNGHFPQTRMKYRLSLFLSWTAYGHGKRAAFFQMLQFYIFLALFCKVCYNRCMIKKICNRCGRLYENICPCRKDTKREYMHDTFYDTGHWKAISRTVKQRDFYSDRLALYLIRSDMPQNANENEYTYKLLHGYLIDATGEERHMNKGRLLVHHIVSKEEDSSLQYVLDNMITLNFYAHEFIHQLYKTPNKEDVQTILRNAVAATLP